MKNKQFMKNGFTLVEILAVVFVLSIIVVIFVPNVSKILDENNLKIYKIKEKELLKAAEDYTQYEKSFSPPLEGVEKYITMSQLVSKNYMNKILDTETGNECVGFVRVTINNIYGYNYESCLICDKYKTNKEFCNMTIYGDL